MNKLAVGILTLLVALALPTASSTTEYYLVPDNSGVTDYGDCTNVSLMLNVTQGIQSGLASILFDTSCAEVTSFTWTGATCFNKPATIVIRMDTVPGRLTVGFGNELPGYPPSPLNTSCRGPVHLGNFTIRCNTTSPPCQTDLVFYEGSDMWTSGVWDDNFQPVPFTTDNGTFTCGTTPAEEPFSKPIYEGWNLISLPLDPADDNSASAVLSTVSYDAVYKYNATATSKQFEVIESTDAMNPGTGYFVHATTDCTWTYSGTAYNSMSTPLEPGLNMVGWLNCSKDVDALSSISKDHHYYVARWNTSAEKFEVYNPAAPPAFNDFTTMERGTGYFISTKQGCTLSESC